MALTVGLTPELSTMLFDVHGLNIKRVRVLNRLGAGTTCKHGKRRFILPTDQLDWSTKKRD